MFITLNFNCQSIAGTSYTCVWAVGANGDALYRKGVRQENPLVRMNYCIVLQALYYFTV